MLGCFAVNTIGVFADEWSATDNHLGVIHFQAQGEREGMRWNRENSAGKCSVLVIVLQLVFPFSFLFYFIFTWLFIFLSALEHHFGVFQKHVERCEKDDKLYLKS